MVHWHVVVEAADELYGKRSYVVRELARAEDERAIERQGSTITNPRQVIITNCVSDCLGYQQPPKVRV